MTREMVWLGRDDLLQTDTDDEWNLAYEIVVRKNNMKTRMNKYEVCYGRSRHGNWVNMESLQPN